MTSLYTKKSKNHKHFFVKSEKASKQASSELEPEGPTEIPPDFPEMNDSFQVCKHPNNPSLFFVSVASCLSRKQPKK